jgi:hypothetical protein
LKHKHDQQECQERGMSYSLRQRSGHRSAVHPRHQGRRSLLRRNSADD